MYEAFYKLRASPFRLIPDPMFFYDSDTHRHGLVKLRQAIRNGCSITAVTGAPGTGKTELMRKFMSEFDPKDTVIANIPLTSLRSNNILDYIATAFGVVNMGFVGDALWSKTAFLGKIQQHISAEIGEGKKFIIVIDNAESLSRNCLKKIMQLCSVRIQGAPLAQCFLFGETSVTVNLKLDVTNLGLHAISGIRLETFDLQETRRYVEHRLLQAGWQGDPEITDAAYKMMHYISEGVPWHINLLCHRVFLQGFLEDTHVIDEHVVGMFLTDRELENVNVSGSDVNVTSNVINLNRTNTGRDTKGTSFSSTANSNNYNKTQAVKLEMRDSISHFFDEYDKTNISWETESDELAIAIDVVEEAFNASIGDEVSSGSASAAGGSAAESFPEVTDRVELNEVEKGVTDAMNCSSDNVIQKAGLDSEHQPSDSIMEKIFPRTTAMLEAYSQAPQFKSYSALDIPGYLQEEESYQPDEPEHNEYDQQNRHYVNKSPTQIAARASIVTSLVITLVMWVISDTRTADTQFSQPDVARIQLLKKQSSPQHKINTTTPSPYEQYDDRAKARDILKQ